MNKHMRKVVEEVYQETQGYSLEVLIEKHADPDLLEWHGQGAVNLLPGRMERLYGGIWEDAVKAVDSRVHLQSFSSVSPSRVAVLASLVAIRYAEYIQVLRKEVLALPYGQARLVMTREELYQLLDHRVFLRRDIHNALVDLSAGLLPGWLRRIYIEKGYHPAMPKANGLLAS